jgi:hypothetical protein
LYFFAVVLEIEIDPKVFAIIGTDTRQPLLSREKFAKKPKALQACEFNVIADTAPDSVSPCPQK